jgi:hypothetical protein
LWIGSETFAYLKKHDTHRGFFALRKLLYRQIRFGEYSAQLSTYSAHWTFVGGGRDCDHRPRTQRTPEKRHRNRSVRMPSYWWQSFRTSTEQRARRDTPHLFVPIRKRYRVYDSLHFPRIYEYRTTDRHSFVKDVSMVS